MLMRPWMVVQVSLSCLLLGYVGVNLGSGWTGVAQQLLNYPQVGPTFHKVAGEGMAQCVRMHPAPDSGLSGAPLDELLNAAPGEALAITVEKQGWRSFLDQLRTNLL